MPMTAIPRRPPPIGSKICGVGWEQRAGAGGFTEFARLDNLANRAYVGSVIVNESNSRFFEPAPGRTAFIMFTAAWHSD
jgi:iron complex outermembrane recepter protein